MKLFEELESQVDNVDREGQVADHWPQKEGHIASSSFVRVIQKLADMKDLLQNKLFVLKFLNQEAEFRDFRQQRVQFIGSALLQPVNIHFLRGSKPVSSSIHNKIATEWHFQG
jgi:hypothetical protein